MGEIKVKGLGDGSFNVILECEGLSVQRVVVGMENIESNLLNMLYELKCNE